MHPRMCAQARVRTSRMMPRSSFLNNAISSLMFDSLPSCSWPTCPGRPVRACACARVSTAGMRGHLVHQPDHLLAHLREQCRVARDARLERRVLLQTKQIRPARGRVCVSVRGCVRWSEQAAGWKKEQLSENGRVPVCAQQGVGREERGGRWGRGWLPLRWISAARRRRPPNAPAPPAVLSVPYRAANHPQTPLCVRVARAYVHLRGRDCARVCLCDASARAMAAVPCLRARTPRRCRARALLR